MKETQKISHNKGSAPSTASMTRQFQRSSSQPESGAATINEIGIAIENKEFALARSLRGNQCEIMTRVAGYMPPSATPSSNRITHISCQLWTNAQATAAPPHMTSKILTNHFVLQRLAKY